MKKKYLSDEEQIQAMLDGNIYKILKKHAGLESDYFDLKEFVSIDRNRLASYLKEHQDVVKIHLRKIIERDVFHDALKVWANRGKYKMAMMDHGQARWIREFNSAEEVIAAYVFVSHGM